jgi:hypothetical protein
MQGVWVLSVNSMQVLSSQIFIASFHASFLP